MTGHLRVVDDDPTVTDPVEEIEEGMEVLGRLAHNPLLKGFSQDAILSTRRLLELHMPRGAGR